MNVTITCLSPGYTEYVKDELDKIVGPKQRKPLSEALSDVLQYDLTNEQIAAASEIEGVASVTSDDSRFNLHYNIVSQQGQPKLASYTTNFNGNTIQDCVPHSLYYCQSYDLRFTHEFPTNGSNVTLSSIDCSNVDVIVLDTGIDPTHPDFVSTTNQPTVVQFDWTKLKSGDPITGTQIVTSQSSQYYEDTDGHGTSCASLIAGKRCGFAKNAKIYSLRAKGLDSGASLHGFDITKCLDLAIAFHKAKKLNLHGLDSSRPTVFSNSWGYTGPQIADDVVTDSNNLNFYYSADCGNNMLGYNKLPGINSIADGYIRTCLTEGIHTLFAAGNINNFLTNNPVSSVNVHEFQRSGQNFVIVRSQANNSSFVVNQNYNGYTYKGVGIRHLYTSPNIGINFKKDDYPLIIVGDIIPLGDNDQHSNTYWSAANACTAFRVLSGISAETRINTTDTRYETVSGAKFLKSAYSSFGPDVDVYAPGNGAWAALSKYATSSTPQFTSGTPTNKFHWFNGTSSACPIAAGVLATFLSEYPTATPKQAREWLMSNGIKGNILQTEPTFLPVSTYDGTTSRTLQVPFGANFAALRNDSKYRLQRGGAAQLSLFNTANIEDVLFCNRLFLSNNIIVQAYPLRKAIVKSSNSTYTIAATNLTQSGSPTTKRQTHTT